VSDGEQVSRRRDARRNHAALVAAAEVEFSVSGPDVPLDAVVRRAGVGRGTLYRHFAGRVDLAMAIYEQHIAEHETYAAAHAHEPDLVFRLLERMADVQVRTRGVMMVLAREPDGEARIGLLVARIRALFESTLARGRAAGLVASDITADDLLLVLGMVEGALVGVPLDRAPAVAHRVVALVGPALRALPTGA
jgi:AcrR family transcriptional regulator